MRIMQLITDYIRKSILTTHGDLVVRGATIPERLAAVAVGQVLKSAGVGAKPAWGGPSIGDMNMAAGSYGVSVGGDIVTTGLGFLPKLLFFLSHDLTSANMNFCFGIDNNVNMCEVFQHTSGSDFFHNVTASITIKRDVSNHIIGSVTALGGDGFTVSYILTGTCGVSVTWFAIG